MKPSHSLIDNYVDTSVSLIVVKGTKKGTFIVLKGTKQGTFMWYFLTVHLVSLIRHYCRRIK